MHTPRTTITEQIDDLDARAKSQTLSGSLESIPVSYASNICINKTSLQSFQWIADRIRTSEELRLKITTIRSASPEKRQELKKELLPYFSTARFEGGIRKNNHFKAIQYVIIDVDHITERLDELRKKIRHDREVFMSFLSPSGDGLKIIFLLDREITDEGEYTAIYQHLRGRLKDRYDVECDHTSDPARACFLSSDPDIYINESCATISTELVRDVRQCTLPKRKFKELLASKNPGDRTPTLASQVGTWIKRGIPMEEALEMCCLWNRKNAEPLSDEKVEATVIDMYERYDSIALKLPIQFYSRNNCYYKKVVSKDKTTDIMVTTFIIEPKELLVQDGNDCLVCDVRSSQGYHYTSILIESTDWHSKQKFLKAIGHQDCVCIGSDNDLQALCAYVNSLVPMRKKGTKVVGLNEDMWVVEGLNISRSGITTEPSIVPYDKGSGAFFHKIGYRMLPDEELRTLISGFYRDITKINEVNIILPFVGWVFASPVKELIRHQLGSFPSILVHGGQGSGKSSMAKLFMRIVGYKNPVPNKCDMRPFPMLKNLSATNGVPQFYDEFKVSDMKQDAVDSLLRYIREIYDGEMEQKGREDQTTVDYELLAPIAVMGEWNINQPAIRERSLMVRFTDSVKKNVKMREAYRRLWDLPLEGLMPRYIQFCLSQDIGAMIERSRSQVEGCFKDKTVAPRIVNNLSVMLLGLCLFQEYAAHCSVDISAVDPEKILAAQLREITGTDSGLVRSSVDQLIEELGIMWQKNEKQIVSAIPGYEPSLRQVPWWKRATVDGKDVVAIRFNKIFPEFKEYAQRTHYEGDLLDKESYMRLFKECEYILGVDHVVSYDGNKQRALCIDTQKAKASGIDLEGFGIE